MKTRPLTTILMSAYLSAMLASSVAPIRSDATLAGTIDPMAAQKALQSAVSNLGAAGWAAAPASAAASVPVPTSNTPSANPGTKTDPTMNEELMGRLIKYTRGTRGTGTLGAGVCKVFDLCDGTKDIAVKLAKSDSTDGLHLFGLLPDLESKDILILVKRDTIAEAYLTDITGKLRAAALSKNGVAHLITNEKAEANFKAELTLFAGEAAGLPPVGTTFASVR